MESLHASAGEECVKNVTEEDCIHYKIEPAPDQWALVARAPTTRLVARG